MPSAKVLPALALAGSVLPASADLIGTLVSASQITLQIEFGLSAGGFVTTADFTGNSLGLKFVLGGTTFSAGPRNFTFTDTAFAGLSIVETSDNFPSGGVTESLVGDVLTLSAPSTTDRTFTADFSIAPQTTPLPAALPLFATGIGGLGLLGWRRKRKAQ